MSYEFSPILTSDCHSSYAFSTSSGQLYRVDFDDAASKFPETCQTCEEVFELGFYRLNETIASNRSDAEIAATIIDIIDHFSSKNKAGIFYVCDSLDQKEACRSRLFNSWFNKSKSSSKYHKREFQSNNQGFHLFATLLIPVNHRYINAMNNDFDEMVREYEEAEY